MKRLISYTILIALILFIGNNQAFSQNNVTARADVVANVTTEDTKILSFATVTDQLGSNSPTISPTDGSQSGGGFVNGTPQVGRLVISGSSSASISVTFSSSDLSDGSNTITFNPNVVGATGDARTDNADVANDCNSCGNQVTISEGENSDGGTNFVTDSNGFFSIWIGGDISGTDGQNAARYEGNQTFTITYL